jgi:hypothetical protein
VKYFFDSEFLEDGSTIDLISIAFVAEDGREYYAVNMNADWGRIHEDAWLMGNVVSQLPDDSEWKPKKQIAAEVLEFLLAGDGRPELWAWYSAYDHVAYAQLWGKMINLPEGLPMYTNDAKSFLHWALPRVQDRNGFPAQAEGVHDALADARHLKVRYDWIVERRHARDTDKIVERLLEAKREAMQEAIYSLIEAKRRNENPFTAANIEIEKFKLQTEIDLLEWLCA